MGVNQVGFALHFSAFVARIRQKAILISDLRRTPRCDDFYGLPKGIPDRAAIAYCPVDSLGFTRLISLQKFSGRQDILFSGKVRHDIIAFLCSVAGFLRSIFQSCCYPLSRDCGTSFDFAMLPEDWSVLQRGHDLNRFPVNPRICHPYSHDRQRCNAAQRTAQSPRPHRSPHQYGKLGVISIPVNTPYL